MMGKAVHVWGIWDISLCTTIDVSSQSCCETKTAVKNSLFFFSSDSGSHGCSKEKKNPSTPSLTNLQIESGSEEKGGRSTGLPSSHLFCALHSARC